MANFYDNLGQAMAGVASNVQSSMDSDGYDSAPQVNFQALMPLTCPHVSQSITACCKISAACCPLNS